MADPESPWRRFRDLGLSSGQRALLETWRTLDLRRLWRVLLHSLLVGALAGLAACVFFAALEWAQRLFLGAVARVDMPAPGGETSGLADPAADGPIAWLVVAVPTLGGLLVGLIVHFLVPEAKGPGGDAVIDAFHNKGGLVRKRVPLLKGIASLLTLGTGGSAGREGPTMQLSAGIGSTLAQALGLGPRERRMLMVAGAAAGMGAIFRTPLGAALLAVEVLYRDDFESDAIIPAVLASVTSYSIFTTVFGVGHLFTTADFYPFIPAALPLYAVMALGLSLFGAVFVRMRHLSEDRLFGPLAVPGWVKPAIGGALLGMLALVVPQALGTGYGWVQGAISTHEWVPVAWDGVWMLLGLAAVKMIATSLSVGSGGSGGDFGPSLVIGGLCGGGFGLLFHLVAPDLVPDPGAFALVGMGAFVGGIGHVPVSSLIIVCEMTGSYDLLVPLMLAEGITFVLLRRVAIYRRQVRSRLDSPAHRDEVTVDILESICVQDVFEKGAQLSEVQARAPLREVLRVLSGSRYPAVLVRDAEGRLVGEISLDAIQGALLEEGLEGVLLAADVMGKLPRLAPSDDLHTALHHFLVSGATVLPVVDPELHGQPIVGVLTQVQVTQAYDDAIERRLVGAGPTD